MKKHRILIAALMLAAILPVFSQLDLKEKAQLVGIQVESKPGATTEETMADVSFIFVDRPTAYYHNIKDSVLTVDFFDAVLGEEKLPDIKEAPFAGCVITREKLNVNKDIEGLAPEFKDVVRVTFALQTGVKIDYTMSDDFNVVTLSSTWSKTGAITTKKTTKKSKAWMWIVGGVVGISGAAIAYIMMNTDTTETKPPPPPIWDPVPALPPEL